LSAQEPGGLEPRKAFTNVLLNSDRSFRAFGKQARDEYQNHIAGARRPPCCC